MKNRLLRLMALASAVLCLGGCSEENGGNIIYDFAPINLYVYLEDSEGSNLLDPATANGIDYHGISVDCGQGQALSVELDTLRGPYLAPTRAYMPYFYGAQLLQGRNGYCLFIGEFDGETDTKGMYITISWGDGETDVLSYRNRVKWKKSKPKVDRHFYLNGKEVANPVFHIVHSQTSGT